jgi:hypothetical protein
MPDTPVDHPTIQEAFNNGEIDKAGYYLLTRQLDDLATPEGFELATMKRRYLGAFKPVVDPNSPEANTEAAAQTVQLEKLLSRKIDDMRASDKDPRDLFDPSKPDYKSPFDLVRNYVPGAQGASLLAVPQSTPTEPEGANKGPQAPDSGPGPEAAAPPTTPPAKSGHLQVDVLAPWEKQPILAWPDAAAPPNQLPRSDGSAETPKPPPSGEASATNHEGKKTSELEDIGFVKGSLRAGFMDLGLDADGAGRLADIVASAASIHPAGRVALAVDDLLTAIRKDDRLGMVEAILALTPAGRFTHIPLPSAPPDTPGSSGGGRPRNPKPEKPSPTEPPATNAEPGGPAMPGTVKPLNATSESPVEASSVVSSPSPESSRGRPDKAEQKPSSPHQRNEFDASKRDLIEPVDRAAIQRELRSNRYRANFWAVHPELRGHVYIHHAIPIYVFKLYPDVIPLSEVHEHANLRGIPATINAAIHLSAIGKEWIDFYRTHPTTATKQEIRNKAIEIDRKFGKTFAPMK